MTDIAKTIGASLVTFGILVSLWIYATGPGGLPPAVLPKPMDVLQTAVEAMSNGSLNPHIAFTVQASLSGLAIGAVLGTVFGSLCVLIPIVEAFVFPLIVTAQSIPKIAVAPIVIAALGYGIEPKIFTVAFLVFFPMFVATVAGMRSVDSSLLDLYKALAASRFHVMLHARIPAAAPFVFSALQISIVLAIIGCVVSEFVASSKGLGFIIKLRSQELDVSMMIVAILILSLLGLAGSIAVKQVQKWVVFWQPN